MPADPVLSVIVAVVSDTVLAPSTDHLHECLQSLVQQESAPPFEVIVPHLPRLPGIAELRSAFPQVRFLEIHDLRRYDGRPGNREHHNELRARGIMAARGKIVALIEDHGVADSHWCARMVEAHTEPVAAVGGAIENGVDRLLNWAVYFCDFGRYQNPLRSGETAASDANVSYKRGALESIRPVWREVFHEGAINQALQMRGERLSASPGVIVFQNRLHLDIGTALKERWVWGKSYGAGRNLTGVSRLVWAGLSLALPALILLRLTATMFGKKRNFGRYCQAFPLTALLVIAWSLGEMAAYLTGASIRYDAPDVAVSGKGGFDVKPRLSVVIVMTAEPGESSGLASTLEAVDRQGDGRPFEVIVPCAVMAQASPLRQRYPGVTFLPVTPVTAPGSGEWLDELRACGVGAATGDIIAVTEDHIRPDPDWSREILKAHEAPYAAIGGAIENGVDRLLNWATYFTDLGRYHNPIPAGQSGYASVVNVSYKRAALEQVRAVWKHRFGETAVHAALMAYGEKLALSPAIVVRQYRDDVTFRASMREFLTWGRSYGSTRAKLAVPAKRLVYAGLSPLIPVVLLLRSGMDVFKKGRLTAAWLKCLPAITALTLAWSGGELMGYLAGEAQPAVSGSAVQESPSVNQ